MSEDKANEPAAEDRATDPSEGVPPSESAAPTSEGEGTPGAESAASADDTLLDSITVPLDKDEESPEGDESGEPAEPVEVPDGAATPAEGAGPVTFEVAESEPVTEPAEGAEPPTETEPSGNAPSDAVAEDEEEPEPEDEPAAEVEAAPKADKTAEAEAEEEEKEKAEDKAAEPVAKAEKEAEPAKAEKAEDEEETPNYYYPNKWARIILTSAEEVMGRQGVNAMLNMAKLPEYIGNYPPDNMKKAFEFEGVGQLQEAIWDFYGPRGARVFAVRAGEQAFLEGLAQFKSVAAAAQVAMRVGSLEAKVKLGLEFFSKFFNTVSDQVVEIDEDDKHWIWRITRCPVCWEREADEPVCHLAIGVLQAALAWTTEDKKFRVMETECKAKGDENCVIKIEKIPVE